MSATLLENYERMNHEALNRESLDNVRGIVAPADFDDSPLDQLRELQRQIEAMAFQ